MSPFNTFHNSGSSSILYFLSQRPSFVRRVESGSVFPERSNFSFIVRNLINWNRRPSIPVRCCRKKTGDPIVIRIKNIIGNTKGMEMLKPIREPKISRNRFNIIETLYLHKASSVMESFLARMGKSWYISTYCRAFFPYSKRFLYVDRVIFSITSARDSGYSGGTVIPQPP